MAGHRGRQEAVRGGRPIVHKVKVLEDQEARLQQMAATQGVTVSRLLVEATLGVESWTITQRRELIAELLRARRALAGVATNLNQIAHFCNSEQRFTGDAARLLPAIEAATDRMTAAVAELRQP